MQFGRTLLDKLASSKLRTRGSHGNLCRRPRGLTREASIRQAFSGVFSVFGLVLPASTFELTFGWNDLAKIDS